MTEAQSAREQHTTFKGVPIAEIVRQRDELREIADLCLDWLESQHPEHAQPEEPCGQGDDTIMCPECRNGCIEMLMDGLRAALSKVAK